MFIHEREMVVAGSFSGWVGDHGAAAVGGEEARAAAPAPGAKLRGGESKGEENLVGVGTCVGDHLRGVVFSAAVAVLEAFGSGGWNALGVVAGGAQCRVLDGDCVRDQPVERAVCSQ